VNEVSSGLRASLLAWDIGSAYRAGSFFVVRSPLLPLFPTPRAGPEPNSTLPKQPAWAARRGELETELLRQLDSPAVRAALFFASPQAFQLVQRAGGRDNPPALLRTLNRYLFRAIGRETPFGLFAGTSVGVPGSEDRFSLRAIQDYRAVTTVAPTRLRSLLQDVALRPSVFGRVAQRLNSTATLVHGNYRFLPTGKRISLTEIEASAAVRSIVVLARDGASPDQMVSGLVEQGFRAADAQASVNELCRLSFLEPRWLPTATGMKAVQVALEQMSGVPDLDADVELLRNVARGLEEADSAGLGSKLGLYQKASARLLESDLGKATRLLSTQLIKPSASLTLSEATQQQLLEAAALLQRTGRVGQSPALHAFVQRFQARYAGRLVPLTEALDQDLGIEFIAEADAIDALVADLPLRRKTSVVRGFDALDTVRLRLLSRTLAERSTVCEIDDASLSEMQSAAGAPSRLPRESFAVLARLARSETGELQIIAPKLFPPGELLGRFAEADPKLLTELERLVATEQQRSERTLLVDVAHFPAGDTANVLVRPSLRSYEIPCFGSSDAPFDRQLPLEDLLVGIENGRAQLYSIKLRQRITIRLLSPYDFNTQQCPSLYRFLGALQDQDWGLVSQWSWGALAGAEFLPRVVRGKTILSLARWRLPVSELTRLAKLDGAQGFEHLQALRAHLSLPRWLVRLQGDERQLIDLDNELSVEEFLYDAAQRDVLVVEELLPTPEQLVLSGPEGKFAAELVVPFIRDHVDPAKSLPAGFELALQPVSERRFTPGSKWLYVKIYCPRSMVQDVLEQVRGAGADAAQPARWFYLPSADPDPHLRVRWACAPDSGADTLARLRSALQPFVDRGTVWHWHLATYEQELEDYGGPDHIELAENVFCADSEAAADLLQLAAGDIELGWLLALVGIDRLFADFELGLTERVELARKYRDGYAQEQGADGRTWRAAKAKYAVYAQEMHDLLWQPSDQRQGLARRAQEIFDQRSQRLAVTCQEYSRRWGEGRLSVGRAELLQSFTHLHAMRLVGISARRHELLLFDFLRRQYSARLATQARHDAPANK
jgi:lantibiotic biosynthesis protein